MKLTPWFPCRKVMPVRSGWYLVTRDKHKDEWLTARFHYFDVSTPDMWWFRKGEAHLPPNYNCFVAKGPGAGKRYWRGVEAP